MCRNEIRLRGIWLRSCYLCKASHWKSSSADRIEKPMGAWMKFNQELVSLLALLVNFPVFHTIKLQASRSLPALITPGSRQCCCSCQSLPCGERTCSHVFLPDLEADKNSNPLFPRAPRCLFSPSCLHLVRPPLHVEGSGVPIALIGLINFSQPFTATRCQVCY
jgi:hypothetical protein